MKCIESDNIDLKYNCALKYAFQLKDPSVCTNVLGGLEDEGELKNSCIYLIFVDAKDAFPDVNTCNLMSKSKTNKNVYFFSDSCYRIVAYDKKDKNICSDMVSNDKRIMCVVDITRDKSLCSGITSAADKYICEQ
jgi:hypothetical protein